MKKKNTVAIAENQERITELENDIKEIKISIDDKDIPEETRSELKESLSAMKEELQGLKDENEKKLKAEKAKAEKPVIKIEGQLYESLSPDEMESSWRGRLSRAEKLGGVAKTKSIVEKISQEEAE